MAEYIAICTVESGVPLAELLVNESIEIIVASETELPHVN